jgi:hypothetical protein
VISAVLVVVLLSVFLELLPDSTLQRQSMKVVRPFVAATGLDQGWGVFAPDPRQQAIAMRARITYADGGREWWDLPDGGPLLGQYWDFRWRKYLEYIINNQFRNILFRPLAVWIAREHDEGGRRPVKVVFVARWYDLYTPVGRGPLRSAWRESAYYTLPVTKAILKDSR